MCPATYVDGGPRRAQPASPPPECGLRAVSSVPDGSAGNLELVDESSADLSTLLRRCAERHVAGAEGFQEEMVQIDASHASSSRKKSQKKLLRRRVLAALRSAGAAATPRLPSEPAAASAVSEGERSCVVTADNRELDIGIRHAGLPLPACSSWWRAGTLARRRPSCLLCHRTQGRRQRSDGSGRSRSERSGACDAVRRCQGVGAAGRRTRLTRRRSWKAGRSDASSRSERSWIAGMRRAAREKLWPTRTRAAGASPTRRPIVGRCTGHGSRVGMLDQAVAHRRARVGVGRSTPLASFEQTRMSSKLAQRPRAISAPPSASVAHNRSQLTSDQLAYLALKVPGEAARARLAASHETFRSQHGLPPSTQQKHGPALDVCHPTPDAYRCACCLRGPLPPAHGQADPSDGEWYCNGCWLG